MFRSRQDPYERILSLMREGDAEGVALLCEKWSKTYFRWPKWFRKMVDESRKNEAAFLAQKWLSEQLGFDLCPYCKWAKKVEEIHQYCENQIFAERTTFYQ